MPWLTAGLDSLTYQLTLLQFEWDHHKPSVDMILTWARCCVWFLWQLPDRPHSLRILRPEGTDIVRPHRGELLSGHIDMVFLRGLRHVSPNPGLPCTPGSRFDGYLQFMKLGRHAPDDDKSQTASQAEPESDTQPDNQPATPPDPKPETNYRDKMWEQVYQKVKKPEADKEKATTPPPPSRPAPSPKTIKHILPQVRKAFQPASSQTSAPAASGAFSSLHLSIPRAQAFSWRHRCHRQCQQSQKQTIADGQQDGQEDQENQEPQGNQQPWQLWGSWANRSSGWQSDGLEQLEQIKSGLVICNLLCV